MDIVEELTKASLPKMAAIADGKRIKNPKKLAKVYQEYKSSGKPLDEVLPFISRRRDGDYDLDRFMAAAGFKTSSPRGRRTFLLMEICLGFNFNPDSLELQIPKKTHSELLTNYNDLTVKRVLEALADFQGAVKASDEGLWIVDNGVKAAQAHREQSRNVIRCCDTMLKDELLSTEQEKVLAAIKKTHEAFVRTISVSSSSSMDIANRVWLLEASIPVVGVEMTCEDLISIIYINQMVFAALGLSKKQGRPTEIFVKALQIVVYETLSKGLVSKKRDPVLFNQSLTASLINAVYKGYVKKLTSKDIENAMHSTT